MSLPRYAEYKESWLPWVGAIPRAWDIKPLMSVARERRESNKGMEEDNLLSLSYGRIVQKDATSNDGLLPESFETYQVVHPDDIVFRLTDLQNDKRSLRTAPVRQKGIITSAYLAVVPRLINSGYFAYLLRSYDLTKVFYSIGGGLRQSMKYADVKRLPVLLPSTREQEAIADFLDCETARIDALIAEQETLLALLAEKRQATISHAVTRGLDPNVPMKDSGIAWLGEVPAHWNVVLLRRIVSAVETGTTPISGPSVEAVESGTGWFTPGDFTALDLTASTKFVAKEHVAGGEVRCFPEGAILVVGIGATLGKVGILNAPASANQQVNAILIGAGHSARFFAYSLSAKAEIMKFLSNSSTIGILNQAKTKEIPIAVPPFDEQRRVVDELDFEVRKFDAISAEAELAKTLLRERRSALISAAVTGQIDVRGLVSGAAA